MTDERFAELVEKADALVLKIAGTYDRRDQVFMDILRHAIDNEQRKEWAASAGTSDQTASSSRQTAIME